MLKVARYLPSLSIHYVAMNNDLEKLPPQMNQIKMQWHRSLRSNEMTLLPNLLSAVFLGTGNCSFKSFTGAFSSNYFFDVREVYAKSVRTLSRYFGIKFLWLAIRKNGQSRRSAFDMQFHLIVVSIFLKTCERSWTRQLQPIARKKDWISMYRGALVICL